MKDNQLFTQLIAEFEAPAFTELDDEVAATCSGGLTKRESNPDVLLFEDTNYRGDILSINGTVGDGDGNLDDSIFGSGWNDRTSSIIVRNGTWRIYQNDGYRGQSVTLTPGSYANANAFGLANDSLTGILRIA